MLCDDVKGQVLPPEAQGVNEIWLSVVNYGLGGCCSARW